MRDLRKRIERLETADEETIGIDECRRLLAHLLGVADTDLPASGDER